MDGCRVVYKQAQATKKRGCPMGSYMPDFQLPEYVGDIVC
jgi:hypothetical protein